MSDDGGKVTRIGGRLAEARAVKPRRQDALPEDCPVYALGQSGTHFWFLNTLQQVVQVPLGRLNGGVIQGLFAGHQGYLEAHWSKENKHGEIIGFDTQAAATSLLAACQAMGMYDGTQDVLRGRGAHPGADGDLILNLGNQLWVRGLVERVGARDDGYIYPRGNTLAQPHATKQEDGPGGPAALVEDLFRAWNWADNISARLLLGWVCMAMVGGAVPWRAHVWVTAEKGSGKSTLLKFVAAILGDLSVKADDATAASLRVIMGHDTLAMVLDETEAKPDNHRLNGLIEMARLSSSGGRALRATSGQEVMSFTLRSPVLLSSVFAPPLRSQDQSRFAILKMRMNTAGAEPIFRSEFWRTVGRQLLRRMTDHWKRLPETLELWREALRDAGIGRSRDTDQYGILMACAEVAMWDAPRDASERERFARQIVDVTEEARTDQAPEWKRLLIQMASTAVSATRGGVAEQLGDIIARAARRQCMRNPEGGPDTRPTEQDADAANRVLASLGLRVVLMEHPQSKRPLRTWLDDPTRAPAPEGNGEYLGHLAIANSHAQLNSVVFRGTHYQASSGTSGGWKAPLMEAPGVVIEKTMKFGQVASRGVKVPLGLVLDGEGEVVE